MTTEAMQPTILFGTQWFSERRDTGRRAVAFDRLWHEVEMVLDEEGAGEPRYEVFHRGESVGQAVRRGGTWHLYLGGRIMPSVSDEYLAGFLPKVEAALSGEVRQSDADAAYDEVVRERDEARDSDAHHQRLYQKAREAAGARAGETLLDAIERMKGRFEELEASYADLWAACDGALPEMREHAARHEDLAELRAKPPF